MSARRSITALSVTALSVAALLVAGALPVLSSPAQAVVSQDKIVLVGGAVKAKVADVIVANADGTGQKIVRHGTSGQVPSYASIAPATNRIAELYSPGGKAGGPGGLVVMNRDGSGFRVVAKETSKLSFDHVRWNANGTKLLVSVSSSSSGYLAILDLSVAHPILKRVPGSTGLTDASFATTTDATVIASDDAGNIVTVHAGAVTTVLAGGSTMYDFPSFAPGDAKIVFSALSFSGTSLVAGIDTATPDGNNITVVTSSASFALAPFWSSNSGTIFFDLIDTKKFAIAAYKVPAAGGTATKLAVGAGKMLLIGGVAAPDTTAPSSATSLKVTLNGTTPTIAWGRPADPDVSHFLLRRVEGTTPPASTSDGVAVYSGPKASVVDNVVVGHTYSYAVWAVDGSGNVSADRDQTTVALRAPILKAPPVVSSISVDTTFKVSWAPSIANPPLTFYTVQWLKGDGTWGTWVDADVITTATFGAGGVPVTTAAGKTYKLRAFVADSYGNTSAKTVVAWVEPKDDQIATEKGAWTDAHSSNYWLTTARTTTHAKAALSIGLTGSTLWIIGERIAKGSKAEVYVDGKLVATIDTHGSAAYRHILWTKKVEAGKHILRIVNLATAGRSRLTIDAFAAR